jgi:hypothetical protein
VEEPINHLKRGYGLRSTRLNGRQGHQIRDRSAAFTYNVDTDIPSRKENHPSTPREVRSPTRTGRRDHYPFTTGTIRATLPHWSVRPSGFSRRKSLIHATLAVGRGGWLDIHAHGVRLLTGLVVINRNPVARASWKGPLGTQRSPPPQTAST